MYTAQVDHGRPLWRREIFDVGESKVFVFSSFVLTCYSSEMQNVTTGVVSNCKSEIFNKINVQDKASKLA